MENTALNGTTVTKDQEWKTKKGYGPIVAVSLALLLGLSFYAGRHSAVMRMTNGVASSSSSSSLVGSDTAASDLKTLTIAVDDDEVIESLLSGWLPPGGGNVGATPRCYEAPEDCAIPPGMTHPNCVCPFEDPEACYCLSGQPDALCAATSDCVKPLGLDHPVCLSDGSNKRCQSGQPGSLCDQTSDCVAPPGLNHPVCRSNGSYLSCQSGQPGSLCGVTEDCVVPPGLDHAVCRNNKCQQGVKGDYCGQDNDCLSGMKCHGVGDSRKCK